jgi:hypothetical protein
VSLPVLLQGWQSIMLRLAKTCTNTREWFSLRN